MANELYNFPLRRMLAQDGSPARNIRRYVYDVGTLPNNTGVNTPHGLSTAELESIVHISGRAHSPGAGEVIPLPHCHGSEEVRVFVDATNIVTSSIIANMSDFTDTAVYIDLLVE